MFTQSPLLYYIRKYRRSFGFGMFFLIITNTLDGVSPLVMKAGIDEVTSGHAGENLAKISLQFLLIMSGLAVTRYLWRTFFGEYHTRAAEDLRRKLYRHLLDLDLQFYSKTQIGELMSLIVNDVQAFRQAIGSAILILVDGAIIVAVILPIMIGLNLNWTMRTLILLPLIPVLIRVVTQLIFKLYKAEQENLSTLSGYTQETISGIRVLKSFVQEKTRQVGYSKLNLKYEGSQNQVAFVDSLFSPVMQFGVAAGSVILIFISAEDLLSGAASIGTFVAFQRYISKMVWPMTAFGLGFSEFQKGMASYSRIKNVLETKSKIQDHGKLELSELKSLSANQLLFAYENQVQPKQNSISFQIQKGDHLGLIGPIGSGKTTLAQLITRLLPCQPGQIKINEANIEDYTLDSIRKNICLVTQEPLLFSMSIFENLKLAAENISENEIKQSLIDVQIWDEIQKLPNGLQTELGEKGVNLSGGQKQRLALARGLLAGADLIILDDVMSAVDPSTEKQLIQTIEKLGKTLIVISHRLSVLSSCNKLLVLNDSGFEDFGLPAELETRSKTYQNLREHQGEALS